MRSLENIVGAVFELCLSLCAGRSCHYLAVGGSIITQIWHFLFSSVDLFPAISPTYLLNVLQNDNNDSS